jgi:hypothetical protein
MVRFGWSAPLKCAVDACGHSVWQRKQKREKGHDTNSILFA